MKFMVTIRPKRYITRMWIEAKHHLQAEEIARGAMESEIMPEAITNIRVNEDPQSYEVISQETREYQEPPG